MVDKQIRRDDQNTVILTTLKNSFYRSNKTDPHLVREWERFKLKMVSFPEIIMI